MVKHILIVDDSPLIHTMLKKTLEANDYAVVGIAKNGKEAIDLYQQLRPDAVFMDINMPIMDGFTATRKIKEINPLANVIILSAVGDEDTMKRAKILGVKTFLKKPFTEYSVISTLSKL